MNRQQYISWLGRGIVFFENPDNVNERFEDRYDLSDIRLLATIALLDAPDTVPEYQLYTEDELGDITLQQFEKELGRIDRALIERTGNLNPEIDQWVKEVERIRAEADLGKMGEELRSLRVNVTRREKDFLGWSAAVKETVGAAGQEDVIEPSEVEKIKIVLNVDRERSKAAIAYLISKETNLPPAQIAGIVNNYVDNYLEKSQQGQAVARLETTKIVKTLESIRPGEHRAVRVFEVVAIPAEIATAAVGVALGDEKTKTRLINEAKEKPLQLEERFARQFQRDVASLNPSIPPQALGEGVSRAAKVYVEEYLSKASPSEVIQVVDVGKLEAEIEAQRPIVFENITTAAQPSEGPLVQLARQDPTALKAEIRREAFGESRLTPLEEGNLDRVAQDFSREVKETPLGTTVTVEMSMPQLRAKINQPGLTLDQVISEAGTQKAEQDFGAQTEIVRGLANEINEEERLPVVPARMRAVERIGGEVLRAGEIAATAPLIIAEGKGKPGRNADEVVEEVKEEVHLSPAQEKRVRELVEQAGKIEGGREVDPHLIAERIGQHVTVDQVLTTEKAKGPQEGEFDSRTPLEKELETITKIAAIPLVAANPQTVQDLRDKAKDTPDDLTRDVAVKLTNIPEGGATAEETARAYVEELQKPEDGTVPIIKSTGEIYRVPTNSWSNLEAVKVILATDEGANLVEDINQRPEYYINNFAEQIPGDREVARVSATRYVESLSKWKAGDPVLTVTNDGRVLQVPPEEAIEATSEDFKGHGSEARASLNKAIKSAKGDASNMVIDSRKLSPENVNTSADLWGAVAGAYVAGEVFPEVVEARLAYEEAYGSTTITAFRALTITSEKVNAKENPEKALGLVLISRGIGPNLLVEKLQEAGFSEAQAKLYVENLSTFRELDKAVPGLAAAIARKQPNLQEVDLRTIRGIFGAPEEMSGVGDFYDASTLYTNYKMNFPDPSGVGGLILGIDRRFLGGRARKFLDRYVNKVKNRARDYALKKTGKFIADIGFGELGAAIGSTIPVVGTVVGWVIGKVAEKLVVPVSRGLKKSWGKILALAGLAIGFAIGGPVGAIVGGIGGAAIAGVDWKKWENRAKALASLVLAYFLAKIIAYLTVMAVILVILPFIVALVYFIINAGAYVVPPPTYISGGTTGGVVGQSCFVLDNTWSEPQKSQVTAAVNQLSKAGYYMAKLCPPGAGNITLSFRPELVSSLGFGELGGETPGDPPGLILLAPLGLGSLFNATFTLTHESGHVLAQRSNWYQVFLDTPSVRPEIPTCTYLGVPHNTQEDFAEMIGRYEAETLRANINVWLCRTVNGGIVSVSPPNNWRANYPSTWQFGHDKIYQENLGWP